MKSENLNTADNQTKRMNKQTQRIDSANKDLDEIMENCFEISYLFLICILDLSEFCSISTGCMRMLLYFRLDSTRLGSTIRTYTIQYGRYSAGTNMLGNEPPRLHFHLEYYEWHHYCWCCSMVLHLR